MTQEDLVCVVCNGKGEVVCGHCLSDAPVLWTLLVDCNKCDGKGVIKCVQCEGTGVDNLPW